MKLSTTFVSLTILLLPLCSFAASVPIEELCEKVSCREDTKVFLAIDAEENWEGTFPKSPYVINENLVNLIPGETIYLTATTAEGTLTELTATTFKPTEGEVIVVSFQQKDEDKEHKYKYMVLKISNPYTKPLKYSASMNLLGEQGMYKTSTCPVFPEKATYESWPHPILRIVMENFHFVESNSMECKEPNNYQAPGRQE